MVDLADGANRPIDETENVGSEKLNAVLDVDAKALSEQHLDAVQKLCQEQAAEIATLHTEIDQLRAAGGGRVAPCAGAIAACGISLAEP